MRRNEIKIRQNRITLKGGDFDATKKIRITVSLFSATSSGRYLSSLIEWLNAREVQHLQIQISDSLQRFNMEWQRKINTTDAYRESLEQGDKWVESNIAAIKYSISNFECFCITKWDYWRDLVNKSNHLERIEILYENDQVFRDLVEQQIVSYFGRIGRSLDQERASLSRKFIMEELAVDLVASIDREFVDIYPGGPFPARDYIFKNCDLVEVPSKDRFLFVEYD